MMNNHGFLSAEEFQALFDEYSHGMTRLQVQFAVNAASGMTQRAAYVKAGGTAKKDTSQDTQASSLMSNQKVKRLYGLMVRKAAEDSVMTKTESMNILSNIARARIDDFMTYEFYEHFDDETGDKELRVKYTTKDSADIPPHLMNAVASVVMTPSGPKFTLKDSVAALKQLSKMLGWDSPLEVTTPEDRPFETKGKTTIEIDDVKDALDGLMDKL